MCYWIFSTLLAPIAVNINPILRLVEVPRESLGFTVETLLTTVVECDQNKISAKYCNSTLPNHDYPTNTIILRTLKQPLRQPWSHTAYHHVLKFGDHTI